MKDVNDCSTAELELKKTDVGRPGRIVTRDNFYRVLSDVARYDDKNDLSFDSYATSESLRELSKLCIDKTSKGALFNTLRKMEHQTERVKLYKRKVENITCDDKDLSENYLYKLYNKYIVEAESEIDFYIVGLSDSLNHEIERLQKIVNQIDKKDWDKILAGRRQRFSKQVNRKEKMDIDSSLFRTMQEEKERHGLSWDQYMAALLSLSAIEKNHAIASLDDDFSHEDFDNVKWL